MDVQLLS